MSDYHSLIEYLLSVQDVPEKGELNAGRFLEEPKSPVPHLPETQERQMALQLKKLTNQMPGGFFVYRADGNEEIVYANQAMLRLFNCDTMEEFRAWTGNSFRGIVHPDDLEDVEASIREQIAASQYDLDYVEYRIVQKGGEVRWVEDYGHFIRSESAGNVFYVFVWDATEKRKRLLEEKASLLQENRERERVFQSRIDAFSKKLEDISQEKLQYLEMIAGLSISYESIFYVSLDENMIQPYRVSSRIERQFGKELQAEGFAEFVARYIREWVYSEDRELISKAVEPAYIRRQLADQKAFHINYRVIKQNRTEYLQLFVVTVGSTDDISQVVIGCRSVDDEIRYEMEQNQVLEEALAQAKAANSVKDVFLSNMSHDIRTPMNALVGFTALAKSHFEDKEKLWGYLDMIEASSHQLLQLMDDVLEISRLESGSVHIEETGCSLTDLTQAVQAAVLPQAEAKGIALSLYLDGVEHHQVFCDGQKLTQVLTRLMGNAIKYTEHGGRVSLAVQEQNTSVHYAVYQFVVEDSGIGIGAEFLEHAFEPFEREKNTTLSGVQGTGLGLPIVKSIVEMMGGTIQVSSVSGQGSKFTVTLSLRLQSGLKAPHVDGGRDTAARKPAQRRILLVDDNEINREIEMELLEDAGFLVDMAEDGSVAVEKVRNSRPGDYALVLMDIQMPVMDGYSAARAIRKLEDPALAGIPIVALSANAFEEDRKRSLESGMNAHMEKPIHIPQFLEFLEEIVSPAAPDRGTEKADLTAETQKSIP